MKTKDKKLIYSVLIAIAVIACFAFVFSLLFVNRNDTIFITLYNPITQSKQVIKTTKGHIVDDELKPIEVEGYDFIGWYYDDNLTVKVQKGAIFNSSAILKAGYSKIINISDNSLTSQMSVLVNNKFLTIKSENDNVVTLQELTDILSYKPVYLNLSECKLEVDTLPDFTFYNQTSLLTLFLPSNINTIGEYSFKNCYNLKTLKLGSKVQVIGEGAFYNCLTLEELDLGDNLVQLGKAVFEGCLKLEKLTLGKNLSSLANMAFYGSNIQEINVDELNENYIVNEGVLYTSDFKTLVFVPLLYSDTLTVNELTERIEDYACYNVKNLKSVEFASNISYIGESAFKNCVNLGSILFSNSTNYTIGESAFEKCESLKSVNFGIGLSEIGKSAFKDCKNLTSIVFNISTANGVQNLASIYDSAFKNCKSLTSIIIPDTVSYLGTELFSGCTSLSIVTISSRIKSIPSKMFYGALNLVSVVANGIIDDIDDYAFAECRNLINISTMFSASTLGIGAFRNCESLETANFNNVLNLSSQCFYGCTNLNITSFVSAESIDNLAFANCMTLETFNIAVNLASIATDAFDNCQNLSAFVSTTNSNYVAVDGVLYNYQKNAIICYPIGKKATNFTILSTILNISDKGLYQNQYLQSLSVETGNSVFSSEDGILYNKDKTTLILYPSGKTDTVFSVKAGVLAISAYALSYNNYINTLTIADSVVEIDDNALFEMTAIETLTTPFIGKNSTENKFLGYLFGAYIYNQNFDFVPSTLKKVYLTSDVKVANYCFYDCNNIEYIEFNSEVNVVETSAFQSATSLKEVVFNGTVLYIGAYAFYNLPKLQELTFGFSEKLVLEDRAFGELGLLLKVNIHNNNQNVAQAYKTALIAKFSSMYQNASKWKWYFI